MDVMQATEDDLATILAWLKKEQDDEGFSFIVNEPAIRAFFDQGQLAVIRLDGDAVAFQAGRYSPQITAVRPDLRGSGYGRRLFEWTLAQAEAHDVCILDIDCQPGTSVPFWRHMGFEMEREGSELIELTGSKAHRTLNRRLAMPIGAPTAVVVEFYDETARYEHGEPLAALSAEAVRTPDGRIHLPERVIARGGAGRGEDLHVRLVVDGVEVEFDRAKYHLDQGMRRDPVSGAFFLDSYLPRS